MKRMASCDPITATVTSMAADKLDADLRQPSFTFDVAFLLGGPKKETDEGIGVLSFGVMLPNPSFWVQLIGFLALGVVLGYVVAIINYNLIIKRRGLQDSSCSYVRKVEKYLVGSISISLCLVFPYLVIWTFNVRNMIIKFCVATIMPVLTIFHTMEAMFGTSPPCVESTMGRYALYSSSPLEVCFDQTTCRPITVKLKQTLEAARAFGLALVVLGMYQSTLGPMGYEPFTTQAPLDSMDHTIRDLFSFGHLVNNLVAALLLQLYLTAFCLGLKVVTNIIVGVETKDVMSNAIFRSSSPSDFWGKKWNTLIHGVLKRAVFKPAVRHFPKSMAATAAFFASGLFHEWILSAIFFVHDYEKDEDGQCKLCYHPSYGRNLLFFVINAIIIAVEYYVGEWYIFLWIKKCLPRFLVSILVVSTALPFAHLFTSDYIKSDYFYHGQIGFPLVILLT